MRHVISRAREVAANASSAIPIRATAASVTFRCKLRPRCWVRWQRPPRDARSPPATHRRHLTARSGAAEGRGGTPCECRYSNERRSFRTRPEGRPPLKDGFGVAIPGRRRRSQCLPRAPRPRRRRRHAVVVPAPAHDAPRRRRCAVAYAARVQRYAAAAKACPRAATPPPRPPAARPAQEIGGEAPLPCRPTPGPMPTPGGTERPCDDPEGLVLLS